MVQLSKKLLTPLLALIVLACSGESPTEPQVERFDQTESLTAVQGPVVAAATGGADWVLEVFGFVIPQTLGFSAKKFADGSVAGHINYHQTFLGETLRFTANVTCMEVYDGNRVKYGGEVQTSTDPGFPPGVFIWFQGIDRGQGASAPADLSTGSGFGTAQENEEFCNDPAEPNPLFLAEINGNIDVRS